MPEAPAASVTSLAEDRSGTIWAATDEGLYRYHAGHWQRAVLTSSHPDPTAFAVYIARSGTLWVGTSRALFQRVDQDQFQRAEVSEAVVRDIAEDARRQLWVTDPIAGFRRVGTKGPARQRREGIGLRVFYDRRSNLWIGTRGQGLWRVRPDQDDVLPVIETASVETGLVSNGVWEVLEDREGNIWVASQLGLNRLTPHTVTPIADLGLVHSVEPGADASVWVGTASGLIHLAGDAPTQPSSRTTFKGVQVNALYRDVENRLWLATDHGLGRLAGGRLVQLPPAVSNSTNQFRSITGDGRGGLWLVDSADGLFH